jgi:hypothetical protein
VASLSACAAATTAPLPARLSVSVTQYRLDYAPRALEVSVTNDAPEPVTVTRASFRWPGFTGAATWERDTEIPSGSTRDLRVLLGEPVCAAEAHSAASVAIELRDEDGGPARGALEPSDPLGTIAKVFAADCIAERFAAVASVTTGDELRTETVDGRLVASLDVTVHPQEGGGTARVLGIGRTILVRPADGGQSWPLAWNAGDGSGPLETTIGLIPNNCNPHTVAEDKRGTYFPVEVSFDDATGGTVFAPVSNTVRKQIYAYIAEYCGW